MEVMAGQVDGVELGVGCFDACGIDVWIELAANFEAGFGRGSGDQLDDNLMSDERFAAPFPVMYEKQAVLDLVPFARAGRRGNNGFEAYQLERFDNSSTTNRPAWM
jgi:hypothetical protein